MSAHLVGGHNSLIGGEPGWKGQPLLKGGSVDYVPHLIGYFLERALPVKVVPTFEHPLVPEG